MLWKRRRKTKDGENALNIDCWITYGYLVRQAMQLKNTYGFIQKHDNLVSPVVISSSGQVDFRGRGIHQKKKRRAPKVVCLKCSKYLLHFLVSTALVLMYWLHFSLSIRWLLSPISIPLVWVKHQLPVEHEQQIHNHSFDHAFCALFAIWVSHSI